MLKSSDLFDEMFLDMSHGQREGPAQKPDPGLHEQDTGELQGSAAQTAGTVAPKQMLVGWKSLKFCQLFHF